jgi:BRCT domain type II-containing protein
MGPAKLQKAEKLGIKILSESDFVALIGGGVQTITPENIAIDSEDKRDNKQEDFVQGSLF